MDGVDILLARIKSHPEDFTDVTRDRRWINLYDHAMSGDILKADQVVALQQAMKDARREMFTQRVLKVLAGEPERDFGDSTIQEMNYTQALAKSMSNTKLMVQQSIIDEFNKQYSNFHQPALTKQEKCKETMKQLLDMKKKNGGRYA